MFSERAVKTAKTLWGSDWPHFFSASDPSQKFREPVSLSATERELSQDEMGTLRLLAANGQWSSVVRLSRQLLRRIASEDHHGNRQQQQELLAEPRLSSVEDGTLRQQEQPSSASFSHREQHHEDPEMPREQRGWMRRFPLITAEIQALWMMGQYAQVKEICRAVGDVEERGSSRRHSTSSSNVGGGAGVAGAGRFIHPRTHKNIVPFSFRFLAAIIPYYVDQDAETAEGNLSRLLLAIEGELPAEEQHHRWRRHGSLSQEVDGVGSESIAARSSDRNDDDDAGLLLPVYRVARQRRLRVLRALAFLRYQLRRVTSTIETFGLMLEVEQRYEAMLPKLLKTRGMTPAAAVALAAEQHQRRVDHLFLLQRLLCLCVQVGNSFFATDVLSSLRTLVASWAHEMDEEQEAGGPGTTSPSNRRALAALSTLYLLVVEQSEAYIEMSLQCIGGVRHQEAYTTASNTLQHIISRCTKAIQSLGSPPPLVPEGGDGAVPPVGAKVELENPAILSIALKALYTVRTQSQVSALTALPYRQQAAQQQLSPSTRTTPVRKRTLMWARETEEAVLKALRLNPHGLSHSDAFGFLASRLWRFTAGDQTDQQQEMLNDVIELMRAERPVVAPQTTNRQTSGGP